MISVSRKWIPLVKQAHHLQLNLSQRSHVSICSTYSCIYDYTYIYIYDGDATYTISILYVCNQKTSVSSTWHDMFHQEISRLPVSGESCFLAAAQLLENGKTSFLFLQPFLTKHPWFAQKTNTSIQSKKKSRALEEEIFWLYKA